MTSLVPAPDWLTSIPIAHRGLHDLANGRPENSMAAFRAAVERGYGIECDLQITSTREPVVFHDSQLERLTGQTGSVREKSPEDLGVLNLLNTDETVPTLADMLAMVAGKVPLIIELKGIEHHDEGFVEGVAAHLTSYDGPAAVMSFEHFICKRFARLMPDIPRGLTAEGGEETSDIHMRAMQDFDLNFASYHVDAMPTSFTTSLGKSGIPLISWTVRNQEQMDYSFAQGAQITFERFLPSTDSRP